MRKLRALKEHDALRAYNFALRLTGNDQDARDLVQEAYARALRNIETFDPDRPFSAWFNRILKNIYLDGTRRYDRNHVVSLDGPPPKEDTSWDQIVPGPDETPEQSYSHKEAHDLVWSALDTLPVSYRTAVILCDIERLSYREIGDIMNCPIGTVRSRLHHARTMMRGWISTLERREEKVAVGAGR